MHIESRPAVDFSAQRSSLSGSDKVAAEESWQSGRESLSPSYDTVDLIAFWSRTASRWDGSAGREYCPL